MRFIAKIYIILFLFLTNLLTGQEKILNSASEETDLNASDSIQAPNKLDAPMQYEATDSIVFKVKEKKAFLYNKAKVSYQDFNLESGHIKMDWLNNMTYAQGVMKDSLFEQTPIFKQGSQEIFSDSLAFNIKTKKGYLHHAKMDDGDAMIYADVIKRVNDSVFYGKGAKYTTDKDQNPDYYIKIDKLKIIKDKTTVTGPLQMVIHDVPTQVLTVPFGFLPTGTSGRSGIIIPSFGENRDLGFFLQNLGWYFYINDHVNLKLSTDLYTTGSYALQATSEYKKRYKYSGRFDFQYEKQLRGVLGGDQLDGVTDFSKNVLNRITWSHTQDPKANPNLNFSASVNYSNSQYFRDTYNQNVLTSGAFGTNTTSSNISLTKRWDDFPFTVALSVNHNQNSNTEKISMSLPNLSVSSKTLNPFKPKTGPSKNALHKLSLTYKLNARNQYNISEDNFFKQAMYDSAQTGVQQKLTLSTNTNIATYFNWNISANFNENWSLNLYRKYYNQDTQTVESENYKKFGSFRTFGFSTGLSTNLYGKINFKEGSKIKAIRHILSPSISYNFSPDFASDRWGYFDQYRDANGQRQFYTRFQNATYGSPSSSGLNSSLSISLNNNIEAKVRSKKDPTKYEKIKLLDQLSFNSSYNMARDSLKWSNISMSTSTSFFKNVVRLQYNASFNPYQYNNVVGSFEDKFGLHAQSMNASLGFTLSEKVFTGEQGKNTSEDTDEANKQPTIGLGENIYQNDIFAFNQWGYADFDQPWSLGVNFAWNYNRNYTNTDNSSDFLTLNFNGQLQLTPNWKLTARSGYDFKNNQLSYTNLGFTRDLRSFTINFNWTPNGARSSYFFFIGIKANILQDLKYEERSFPELQ